MFLKSLTLVNLKLMNTLHIFNGCYILLEKNIYNNLENNDHGKVL